MIITYGGNYNNNNRNTLLVNGSANKYKTNNKQTIYHNDIITKTYN